MHTVARLGLLLAGLTCLLNGAALAATVRLDGLPALPSLAPIPPGPQQARSSQARIVLLNEDLVEIAAALGASERIVAQAAVSGLPEVPKPAAIFAQMPGVEGILSLRPTLIVASNAIRSAQLMGDLARLGQNAVIVDGRDPAPQKVRALGALLGESDRAESLAASIEADYQAIDAASDAPKARILHVSTRGAGGNISAAGRDTPAHGLIERAGGRNVGADAGLVRYQSVTPEGVIQMAPEIVVVAVSELDALGGEEQIWQSVPGLALTPAAANRNLIVMRDLHIRANAASSGIAAKGLARAIDTLRQ